MLLLQLNIQSMQQFLFPFPFQEFPLHSLNHFEVINLEII